MLTPVQETEEVGVENVQQARTPAFRLRFPCPGRESPLRRFRCLADGSDFEALCTAEEAVGVLSAGDVAACDEGDLVPKVAKVAVDGRGGQHEDLRVDAVPHDVFHQLFIARFARGLAVDPGAAGVVPEVVGLVDDHQVVVPPS